MSRIRQKPLLGAQLNFAHRLAKGLRYYWRFNEQGGTFALDAVNRFKATGLSFSARGVSTAATYSTVNTPGFDADANHTVLGRCYYVASGTTQYSVLFSPSYYNSGSDQFNIGFQTETLANGGGINCVGYNNDSSFSNKFRFFTTAGWHQFAITQLGSALTFYVDCVPVGTLTMTYRASSNKAIPMANSPAAFIENYLFYGRVLTVAELLSLYADPYQIDFSPATRRLYSFGYKFRRLPDVARTSSRRVA